MSNEERASYEAAFANVRNVECEICVVALERIRKEKGNFLQLDSSKQYNSPAHQKAVTQDSFELLRDDIRRLTYVPEFFHEATALYHLVEHELSRPADKREVKRILPVMESLELRLKHRIKSLSAPTYYPPYYLFQEQGSLARANSITLPP